MSRSYLCSNSGQPSTALLPCILILVPATRNSATYYLLSSWNYNIQETFGDWCCFQNFVAAFRQRNVMFSCLLLRSSHGGMTSNKQAHARMPVGYMDSLEISCQHPHAPRGLPRPDPRGFPPSRVGMDDECYYSSDDDVAKVTDAEELWARNEEGQLCVGSQPMKLMPQEHSDSAPWVAWDERQQCFILATARSTTFSPPPPPVRSIQVHPISPHIFYGRSLLQQHRIIRVRYECDFVPSFLMQCTMRTHGFSLIVFLCRFLRLERERARKQAQREQRAEQEIEARRQHRALPTPQRRRGLLPIRKRKLPTRRCTGQ